MERIKALLFGSISAIEIHTVSEQTGDTLRNGLVASLRLLGPQVPVSIKPARLNVEFVMVHYRAGLLRPAHADVTVLG
jgi:hypothetical protein